MRTGGKRAWLMPAAALVIVLGCASGSKPIDPAAVQARVAASEARYRELARSTIADADRAGTFVGLLDEREALIADQAEAVREYARALKALNADYDATRNDFEQVVLAYNAKRRLAHSRFVDLMTRMKAATTEDEWKKLSKFELKELNPRSLVYAPAGGA